MLGLLLLSAIVGCADYTMTGIQKRQAEILVYPSHINFGNLESGFESEEEYFTVTNTGDDDLIISAPVLVSGNDRFSLLTENEEDIVIPAGEVVQFNVVYEPKTFESNGAYVEIISSDEDERSSMVTLEA